MADKKKDAPEKEADEVKVEAKADKAPKAASKAEGPDEAMVKIVLPVALKIAKKRFHKGEHIVPRHLAETMVEMVDKKMRADISIFTGNNFLVERLAGGNIAVKPVESIDDKLKK